MTPFQLGAAAIKGLVVIGALLGAVPFLVWVERRGSALMQDRLGPNRVGPFGLLQAFADAVKFLMKEDVVPTHVDRLLYLLAPAAILIPSLVTFSVIPFGPSFSFRAFGLSETVNLQVADVDIGVLALLALAATGVYGIILAGWSSNSKYSLMGALRGLAQTISYELAMGFAIVAAVLPASSLRLPAIVEYQRTHVWLVVPQVVGFFVFLIAAFAETNRIPFDLPEAEAELVAGYHTEYSSSMKFACFYMAEYAAMITSSALAVTLYFGGWSLPFLPAEGLIASMAGFVVFSLKVAAFLWLFVWVRWTLPRYRYDSLMRLGWKVLIPLGALNLAWSAFGTSRGWF